MNLTARNNLFLGAQCGRSGSCDSPFAKPAEGIITGSTKWPQTLPNGSIAYIEQPFAVNATLNVFVASACPLFASSGVWPNDGSFYPGAAANASFDNNVYWSTNVTSAPLVFPQDQSFAGWQAESRNDLRSAVADPLIADAGGNNFTLLPGSPALARGFQQIDTSNVGPRR